MRIFLFFNQRNGIKGERESSKKKKVNFEIILDLKLINSSIVRDNLIAGSDNENRERFESKLEKIDRKGIKRDFTNSGSIFNGRKPRFVSRMG